MSRSDRAAARFLRCRQARWVTMTEPERIRGLPVYLVHGTLDWMFPIQTGRTANQALTMAGANVVFREIEDLSHFDVSFVLRQVGGVTLLPQEFSGTEEWL